jgi:hypothetical protein
MWALATCFIWKDGTRWVQEGEPEDEPSLWQSEDEDDWDEPYHGYALHEDYIVDGYAQEAAYVYAKCKAIAMAFGPAWWLSVQGPAASMVMGKGRSRARGRSRRGTKLAAGPRALLSAGPKS